MSVYKFQDRHIGPGEKELGIMLKKAGVSTLEELISQTVPENIRLKEPLKLDEGLPEQQYLREIRELASMNRLFRSYIGMGYYDTVMPAVIQRNVLENPVWYTSYTPYQAEISQGRLEALLNFQTMTGELTGMEIAGASLLDEATAAAEAMGMMFAARSRQKVKEGVNRLLVDEKIWPQTLDVLHTRAEPLGIELEVVPRGSFKLSSPVFGMIVQYPDANGEAADFRELVTQAHAQGILVAVAADLLSLALLTPPGEWGADVVFGSSQRLGIPMGYGGPHAAYFATRDEFKRILPGRIIGVTRDLHGQRALRMALQTREQHIKRDKATSNICTAQALLATMAGFYAAYHGPAGLKGIATGIHTLAVSLAGVLTGLGYRQLNRNYFDTLRIALPGHVVQEEIRKKALAAEMNFRYFENGEIGLSLDETTGSAEADAIAAVFAAAAGKEAPRVPAGDHTTLDPALLRTTPFLQQEVFNRYRSETAMMRYIKSLEVKDLSLAHSMISLGSCTMKLNAAMEMLPLSWSAFNGLHPFAPADQAEGYHRMMHRLCSDLAEITGMAAVSLMPNSGAAGEYAGLMVIREYHRSRGEEQRRVVLIPASAHGTNPASAVMAGMEVVVVECDSRGNIDSDDLMKKAEEHREKLAAFMVTYPSTHGVFEAGISEMCRIVHQMGGQVYMDGANMNAQVGLTNPGVIGADVCHLNLHKTFAIPHGGGGPGAGPIAVAPHLVGFLPSHPVADTGHHGIRAVGAAPWGSASILPITYGYIRMMGAEGLKRATEMAILNANYLAAALNGNYGILYTGEKGRVAHELILECRHLKSRSGITETDIAKRLMDYGFHAPTLSFPVHGTLMIEPTESEPLEELDRFVEAMKQIYAEIAEIESGAADPSDNVLRNAPHTAAEIGSDHWTHPYTREKAAWPLPWVRQQKFWVSVGRVDNAWGDRNLICTCGSPREYELLRQE